MQQLEKAEPDDSCGAGRTGGLGCFWITEHSFDRRFGSVKDGGAGGVPWDDSAAKDSSGTSLGSGQYPLQSQRALEELDHRVRTQQLHDHKLVL